MLRAHYSDLFGWDFDTSDPVPDAFSESSNYGFVNRYMTSDGTGIPGGIGGGMGYQNDTIFYVGVPDVGAALPMAEGLGGKHVIPWGSRDVIRITSRNVILRYN